MRIGSMAEVPARILDDQGQLHGFRQARVVRTPNSFRNFRTFRSRPFWRLNSPHFLPTGGGVSPRRGPAAQPS